jgi:hypothetical protein
MSRVPEPNNETAAHEERTRQATPSEPGQNFDRRPHANGRGVCPRWGVGNVASCGAVSDIHLTDFPAQATIHVRSFGTTVRDSGASALSTRQRWPCTLSLEMPCLEFCFLCLFSMFGRLLQSFSQMRNSIALARTKMGSVESAQSQGQERADEVA